MNRCILVLLLVAVTSCHEIFSYSAGGVDATADDLANSDLAMSDLIEDDLVNNDAGDGNFGLDTLTDCEPPQGDHILATYGFESEEPLWGNEHAIGMCTDQEEMVRCGESAGRAFCSKTSGCKCFYQHVFEPPIYSGSLYIRAYFLLPDVQTSDKMILLRAIGLDGESLSAGISGGGFVTLFNDITDQQQSLYEVDNNWFCLELGIVVDEAAGHLTLWYNDKEVPVGQMTGVATKQNPASGITKVQLGLKMPEDSPLPGEQLAYFDDVVVSTERIYCQD